MLSPVLAALLLAGPAPLEVAAPTCVGLDAREVGRLLQIELTSVTQEIRDGPPLEVRLACTESSMTIAVFDPVTRKRLERDVPAPPAEPGRERVVALAIAQLFAASWLELLLARPDEPTAAAGPPEPAPGTTPETVRAAKSIATSRTEAGRVELLAGAGVRGRGLERAPLPALHVDVDVRGWFGEGVGAMGRVGFDFAQADRSRGDVQALSILVGAGLGWRVRPRPKVGVGGSLVLSGGWGRVRGRSTQAGVPVGTNHSATGELGLSIGPRVFHRRFRMEVDAEVGGTLRNPEGLVAGERPVTLGGVWTGVTVRLGADLSRRR